MAPERSLARNRAAPPTSSWSTLRWRGARSAWARIISVRSPTPRAARVLMGPAEMALTRMFFWPRFQAGLGDGHDVVVGDDFLGGVVAHGHDAAAVGHERGGGAADGDERVDADVHGGAKAFAGGVDELAAELGGGGEGDGVDEDVEPGVLVFQGGEEGVDLTID